MGRAPGPVTQHAAHLASPDLESVCGCCSAASRATAVAAASGAGCGASPAGCQRSSCGTPSSRRRRLRERSRSLLRDRLRLLPRLLSAWVRRERSRLRSPRLGLEPCASIEAAGKGDGQQLWRTVAAAERAMQEWTPCHSATQHTASQPQSAHLGLVARPAGALLLPLLPPLLPPLLLPLLPLLLFLPPLRLVVSRWPAATRCWAAAALPHCRRALSAAAPPCCRPLPAGRPARRGATPQRHLEASAELALQPLKLCMLGSRVHKCTEVSGWPQSGCRAGLEAEAEKSRHSSNSS